MTMGHLNNMKNNDKKFAPVMKLARGCHGLLIMVVAGWLLACYTGFSGDEYGKADKTRNR